jgi:hypothetical protein
MLIEAGTVDRAPEGRSGRSVESVSGSHRHDVAFGGKNSMAHVGNSAGDQAGQVRAVGRTPGAPGPSGTLTTTGLATIAFPIGAKCLGSIALRQPGLATQRRQCSLVYIVRGKEGKQAQKFSSKIFWEKTLSPTLIKGSGAKTRKNWTRCINEIPKLRHTNSKGITLSRPRRVRGVSHTMSGTTGTRRRPPAAGRASRLAQPGSRSSRTRLRPTRSGRGTLAFYVSECHFVPPLAPPFPPM